MESRPTTERSVGPAHKLFLRSARVPTKLTSAHLNGLRNPARTRPAVQTPSGQLRLSFPLTATVPGSWAGSGHVSTTPGPARRARAAPVLSGALFAFRTGGFSRRARYECRGRITVLIWTWSVTFTIECPLPRPTPFCRPSRGRMYSQPENIRPFLKPAPDVTWRCTIKLCSAVTERAKRRHGAPFTPLIRVYAARIPPTPEGWDPAHSGKLNYVMYSHRALLPTSSFAESTFYGH